MLVDQGHRPVGRPLVDQGQQGPGTSVEQSGEGRQLPGSGPQQHPPHPVKLRVGAVPQQDPQRQSHSGAAAQPGRTGQRALIDTGRDHGRHVGAESPFGGVEQLLASPALLVQPGQEQRLPCPAVQQSDTPRRGAFHQPRPGHVDTEFRGTLQSPVAVREVQQCEAQSGQTVQQAGVDVVARTVPGCGEQFAGRFRAADPVQGVSDTAETV